MWSSPLCRTSTPLAPEIAETHSAVVILLGDRAYKVKKPLDLGFLDFTTVESRDAACRRELELNQRLAPDVYLGVAGIHGDDGEVCDSILVMRRLPADHRLSTCLDRGEDVSDALHRIAGDIAALHERSTRNPNLEAVGRREVVASRWRDGFAQLAAVPAGIVEADRVTRIETLAIEYLDGREPLFESRIEHGQIVDGHGDLLADDIFVLDDGPRIIDCLDFDDELRWGDVVADIAFLAMDLERLGHPDAALTFIEEYRTRSGRTWPTSLLHHYIAYRAQVRAKVAAVRIAQEGDSASAARATRELQVLVEVCLHHLEAARVRLVLVGGTPGTGKSTVAAAIGEALGATVVRTDEVRREVRGEMPNRDGNPYSEAAVAATYNESLRRAAELLSLGESVIIDATWSTESHRRLARATAAAASVPLSELRCVAPAEICDERITARLAIGTDPSEATPDVAAAIRERFEPWPTSVAIATDTTVTQACQAALEAITADEVTN